MQEHTVLDLAPLGIDRHTAFGHRREGIGMRACVVDIPALEDIPLGSGRLIVIGAGRAAVRLVVGRQIRAVGDILHYFQLALGVLARDPVPVAVIIRAVHEVQRVDITGIVTIDRRSAAASPGVARGVAELGEAYEIKIVLFLGEITVVRGHRLMQDKALSAVRRIRCLAGKCLDIVIDIFGTVARLIQTERNVLGGHDVDVDKYLIVRGAVLRHPAFALVVRSAIGTDDREVVADALPVESRDFLDRGPTRIVLISYSCVRSAISPAPPHTP